MNLIAKLTGEAARKEAAGKSPFGAGFSEEVATKTETLEVHGSEICDPGPDYCEFRAFDARGNTVGTKRVNGY